MATIARKRPAVGKSRLARDFFAGSYAKIVSETFDATSADARDEDVAFVVGALTFVGRLADAEASLEAYRERTPEGERDPRTLAASRFFLGVAHARAGDFARAHELLASRARTRLRDADPWSRSFVFQGLAAYRYFTGKYRAAARHALRASRAAHAADFAYLQMLANDLRGHALTQLGQFHAGTALLEHAKLYAERLGFGMNAYAIACSIAVYQSKFKVGSEVLGELESLIASRAHDSYSRRTLLTQAAIHYALRGRGKDALAALEQADRDAMRADARRAKVLSLIARLYVLRFRDGPRACADLIDQASSMTEQGDVAFRAELAAFDAAIGRAVGDGARVERALDQLRRFRHSSEHHVARVALERYVPDGARAFVEDELSTLLRAVGERDERVTPRLLALGFLALVPELFGLAPARRVLLVPTENAVLVEDRGDIRLRRSPPPWVLALLRTLDGGASKETIVERLWGLKRYRPDRHDNLVRTTIHRLRTFLEPHGDWVTVTSSGYGLAVEVRAVGTFETSEPDDPALAEGDPLDLPMSRAAGRPVQTAATHGERLVLDRLAVAGSSSVPDLARSLVMSESTVLRALRRLVKARRVVRSGSARATRYRVR